MAVRNLQTHWKNNACHLLHGVVVSWSEPSVFAALCLRVLVASLLFFHVVSNTSFQFSLKNDYERVALTRLTALLFFIEPIFSAPCCFYFTVVLQLDCKNHETHLIIYRHIYIYIYMWGLKRSGLSLEPWSLASCLHSGLEVNWGWLKGTLPLSFDSELGLHAVSAEEHGEVVFSSWLTRNTQVCTCV